MKRPAPFDAGGGPMMKSMSKAQMPMTKAPISKMPPAGSFAKKPPPAIPSKAAIPSKVITSRYKAADAAPGTFASPSPVASPSPTPLSRASSWADFTETDPLYALIGELGDKKVVTADGKLHEDRLTEYIERLCVPGVVQPKDWIEVWAAMNIPVTLPAHSRVVQMILEIGVKSEIGDTMGEVLAHLVTGHRAKVKAVEDALTTIFEYGCDEKDCLARFLLLIFPKSPTSEWGWSRIGWSWKEWWGIADRVFASMEMSGAFEALRSLLSIMETDSGTYLPHQQIWDEKRLALIRAALCKYGSLQEDELTAAVETSLS